MRKTSAQMTASRPHPIQMRHLATKTSTAAPAAAMAVAKAAAMVAVVAANTTAATAQAVGAHSVHMGGLAVRSPHWGPLTETFSAACATMTT